jgi:hypothetical protein
MDDVRAVMEAVELERGAGGQMIAAHGGDVRSEPS